MKRTIRQDERGLWITVENWVLRPRHHVTVATVGDRPTILGGTDPCGARFGTLRFDSGHQERWAIQHSETVDQLTRTTM